MERQNDKIIITHVTVTVHEKRAHPHAMGHKDCEVSLTAELDEEDEIHSILSSLRLKANIHVENELDEWINGIKQERELQLLRIDLSEKLRSVRRASSNEQLEEVRLDTITTIEKLNVEAGADPEEKDEAYKKLAAYVNVAVKRIATQMDDEGESEIPF